MFGHLFEAVGNHWRSLMRFPVARRAVALVASALLTALARPLLGAPPPGFGGWPSEARLAASGLVQGALAVAFAAWVAALGSPAVWIRSRPLRVVATTLTGCLILGWGAVGIVRIASALGSLEGLPAPGVARVFSVAAGAVFTPLAVGALPLVWFYGVEWLTLLPIYRRLFKTGVGPAGGWLAPAKMRGYLRPLPGEKR